MGTMSMDMVPSTLEQVSTTLAGVVAVDGGTIGLDVQFGAFLAVILGTFIPVVFLVPCSSSLRPRALLRPSVSLTRLAAPVSRTSRCSLLCLQRSPLRMPGAWRRAQPDGTAEEA